jgi:hypothetical protein
MRALILILLLCITTVRAEPGKLSVDYTSASQKGQTTSLVSDQTSEIDASSTNLKYSSGLLKNAYRLRLDFTQAKQDLSEYLVREKNGSTTPLSKSFDGSYSSFNLGQDFIYKDMSLGLDYGQTLTTTPLKTQQWAGTLAYQNYAYGMNFTYNFNYKKSSRPLSYISSPETFLGEELATQTDKIDHSLSYDQLLNEYMKSSLSLKESQIRQDRPKNYGARAQLYLAPTLDLGLSLAYEKIVEQKDFLPKDGTGFYQIDSYEAGIAYEFFYRYLVTLNYALIIEEETARGNTPERKIGTDALSLKAEMDYKQFLPFLRAAYEKSNSGRVAQNFAGGLSWEI